MSPLNRLIICLTLVVSLWLPHSVAAQQGSVTFNFNDADIRSVIKSVAKITGRTFIVDPKVKGNVTIVSSQPISADELYGVFLSILQVHDFAAIEAGEVVKIIPYAQAKQDMVATNSHDAEEQPEDRLVTRLYKLQYVPADKLVAVLRPLVTQQSYLAAYKESNMLIIADRAGNVERLLRIVKRIDSEGAGDFEVIQLEHADATDVVTVIEGLEIKSGRVAPDQLRLIADERTNSILVSGESQLMLRAKSLIAHLDTPVKTEGNTQVIFLRYAKAKDLADLLTGLDKGVAGKAGAGKQNDITIQADEGTNALIITAPPPVMRSLQDVIRKLDIRRAQVMIEAVIAEVSTDKAAQLGIQWRSTDSVGASNSGVIGGTNFPSAGLGINSPISEDSVSALAGLSGLSLGFFNGTTTIFGQEILNLSTLINALATDVEANVLSTPSLMTMDNQEAEIVVGQNVPFPTGSYTSTDSGATNPFTTYERQDVGVKLKVTPQINEGNTIRLDIEQEVSSVISNDPEVGGPTTNTRSIKTSVLIEDGKILVLGGLIEDDVQERDQKVPLLGDVPVLGLLFRYKASTRVKKNLMVFLRPVVIRDEQAGARITFDKYDYMRRLQTERRKKDIFLMPGNKPDQLPEYPGDEATTGDAVDRGRPEAE